MRRYLVLVCLGVVLLLGAGSATAQTPVSEPADTTWQTKVAPQLLEAAKKGGQTEMLVVLAEQADVTGAAKFATRADKAAYVYQQVRATAQRTQPALTKMAKASGAEVRSFGIVNALLVEGDTTLVETLAKRADVARVEMNPKVAGLLEAPQAPALQTTGPVWGIAQINAPQAWQLGYRGAGVVVGSADTGVEWTHPAIQSRYRGWNGSTADHNYNWYDPVANTTAPLDDNDHGTHTVGTMVGDAPGHTIGVAPDAKWIACRNMNAGVGTPSLYIGCMEFMMAPFPIGGSFLQNGDPSRGADIVNNSWTCPTSEGCSWQTLQQAVENVRAAGIVFVAAAGNEGPGCTTIAEPPAIYSAALTVGAMDYYGAVAKFSSLGPVATDGSNRPKPDIVAPGTAIESSIRGATYGNKAGTSMAAPHVVGTLALMLSAAPSLNGNVAQLEYLVRISTVRKDDPSCGLYAGGRANNMWGYGLVDALAAVNAARGGGPSVTATPTTVVYPTATPTRTPTSQPTPTRTPTSSPTPTPSSGGAWKASLLWRNLSTGQNTLWLLNGATVTAYPALPTVADLNWKIGAVGDLNADGNTDLVWANASNGQMTAWLINSNNQPSYTALPTNTDANWKLLGAGDLNADGKADLIWRNVSTGQNTAWLMNGASVTSYAALPTLADLNWKVVAIGDLNADRKADLVWRNVSNGQNVAWLMDGANLASYSWLPTVADLNWKVVASGDLNADGKADLVWRNASNGQNVAWLMNGASVTSYPSLPTVADTNWRVVAGIDLDADGKTDLVWRNASNGQNTAWLMNGATVTSYPTLPTVADLNWKVISPASLLTALNDPASGLTKASPDAAKDEAMLGPAPVAAPPVWTPPQTVEPFWSPAAPAAEPPAKGH